MREGDGGERERERERERVTRCNESGGGKGGEKEMRESRKRGAKRLSLLFVYWLMEHHRAVWRVKWVMSCHQTHREKQTPSLSPPPPLLGRHPAVFLRKDERLWSMNERLIRWRRLGPYIFLFLFQTGASCSLRLRCLPLRWEQKLDCLLRDSDTRRYV